MARFEVTLEEGLKRYDDAMDEAEADLIERGLPLAERPAYDGQFATIPKLPPDLSQVGYDVLQRLMGELTEWYNYAQCQLSMAYIRQNCAEAKVKLAWGIIRKLKDGTVADKDDDARADSRYLSVDAGLLYARSMVSYLTAIKNGLEQSISTVSRAITARGERAAIEGRNVGVRRQSETGGRIPSRSALDPFKRRHP